MASKAKKTHDVISQVKDAMERDDWAEVARILSECRRRDSDSIMTQLVSRDQWDAVKQVIPCVGDEERTWNIEGVLVKNNILLSVAEGNWRGIGEMPHERFLHSTLEWILKQACTRAQQTDIVQYVLPHCEDDQLDNVLQQSVIKSQWLLAGKILQKGVHYDQLKWVIEEACRRAKQPDIVNELLPQCPDSLLPAVLRELVSRGLWYAAGQVMGMDISDTLLCWAVVEACQQAEVCQIKYYMLPHCNPDHLNCIMVYFITWCKWTCVRILLTCVEGAITEWTIDGLYLGSNLLDSIANQEWNNMISFVCNCIDDSYQLIAALETKYFFQIFCRSKAGQIQPVFLHPSPFLWKARFPLFVTYLQHVTAVVYQTGVKNMIYLVPRCANGKLDIVFGHVLLHLKASIEKVCPFPNTWAIYKIVLNHEHSDITEVCLSLTTNDQIGNILQRLFTENAWWALGKVLLQDVDDLILTSILENLTCDEDTFLEDILSICNDAQTDFIMGTMVCKGQWASVATLLRLTGDRKLVWTIEGVKVETPTLEMLVEGRSLVGTENAWGSLGKLLAQGVGGAIFIRILDLLKTVSYAEAFLEHLVVICNAAQTDFIMTTMVHRGQWGTVATLLSLTGDRKPMWTIEGVKVETAVLQMLAARDWRRVETAIQGRDSQQTRWLIHALCLHADVIVLEHYVLPNCSENQLDCMLITLVEVNLWRAVGHVLKRSASGSLKRWAVEEACKHYNAYGGDDDFEDPIIKHIIPHCAEHQLDSVLTTLVERRLWRAVGEVLKRGVSDSVKRWAVMEACQYCDDAAGYSNVDGYIKENILPHCADDQLDSVLTTLVERRLWRAVIEVLKRGVCDSVKRWAVMEACQHCFVDGRDCKTDTYVVKDILLHCADDQRDSVLTTLLERRLWWAVGEVLKRGVSDSVKRWAVMEACRHCNAFGDYSNYSDVHTYINRDILPHCAHDQLDSVLTTLVERRLWQCAQHVLERVAGDLNKEFAGQKTCEHCRSAGVYLSKYRIHDSDCLVNKPFTPHCADGNLDSPTSALTKTNACTAVRNMSGREVSDAQRRENIRAAFRHADEDTLMKRIFPYYVYDSLHDALNTLASRGFWSAFLVLLHNSIMDTLYIWAAAKDTEPKDEVFLDVVRNPCDGVKDLTPTMWRSVPWSELQRSLKQHLDWDTPLCEVLCESLLAIARELWLSGREKEIYGPENTSVTKEASSTVEHLHQLLMECKTYHVSDLLSCTVGLRHEHSKNKSGTRFLFQLYCIKNIVHQYYKRKAWKQMTDAILVVLTTVPVVPDVQSVALRVMLRHKRWDAISHACLSGVCEQDRRQLFQAAVKQRQWSAVKRWADHTLYDDQRLWALGEARQEKRWDVYLKLADHGLSEWERVGVLFRVTMHADLTLVHHMLTTVADVTDMIDLLKNTPGVVSKLGVKNIERRMNDLKVFENNLMKDTHTLKTLKTMAKRGKWWVVLHNIRHKPNLQHARRALTVSVSSEALHAVIQLVRLETDVTRRDSLFRDMVRLRQWAVCRELLEQGVSHELSLELLSEFIEHCQWTLVAMVMECTMDDDRRKNIMHQAIMTREGSVVWECIIKLQTRLSVKKREDLFQLAFNREVWQAVKPLIEEKDVTGIRHRDTALLEAIEQHQWDVVDHCQRHHADINMKDDDGHTPIHRAARKGDWEAVKELTVRDGDPNLLDREGLSVLHRTIRAEQWDAVKVLIQFHGDIHLPVAQYQTLVLLPFKFGEARTPLQMLIDARQGEVIESSLMWCPDQQKVVNDKRETVLHAMCLSGWPGALHHLIARKVDPLALTGTGHTALCYAVLCKDCPPRMVAECIKLGFSTHQWSGLLTVEKMRLMMSPLVLAVMRGLPVVTQMLYEAGEYSNRQLCELNVHLVELTKPDTDKGRRFRHAFCVVWADVHNRGYPDPNYPFDTELMEQSADYLHQVSSTPRSLVSTCRLVISRCLTLSKTRHRDIAQLPLSPTMKNYLMFSDLTDPQYPDLSYKS